jgi:hypothetical protein
LNFAFAKLVAQCLNFLLSRIQSEQSSKHKALSSFCPVGVLCGSWRLGGFAFAVMQGFRMLTDRPASYRLAVLTSLLFLIGDRGPTSAESIRPQDSSGPTHF